MMTPKEIVEQWIAYFNAGDVEALAGLYTEDATNHQMANAPVTGRENIRAMFAEEFTHASMTCWVEHIHEDGPWAILEWKDPLGLRGCGFFRVENDKITLQRGYWDQLSFLRLHHLPIPTE